MPFVHVCGIPRSDHGVSIDDYFVGVPVLATPAVETRRKGENAECNLWTTGSKPTSIVSPLTVHLGYRFSENHFNYMYMYVFVCVEHAC